ncbi:ABC transporter substrate-binding protein [Halovenus sp. WSH3]|uniref:ABC transporter substrate-binding protein n=1 Tax=Halovenus carboxidivorans TaxID=2692199 RepID=A0A6B0T7I3_9EURY|nr:cobalamin-binding protein [Halovenus carboxidivorans]MXR51553.1 ABC transporter substrate-binding protein [Halovenus carboxidivorans]
MRVVSLLPSATEMLFALGIEPVGVSHECDYPPRAADLPAVNRSRVDATADSGEIDRQVQEAVEDGGVYEIDRETLADLDPDVIVSQGICDVCAVDDTEIRTAVTELGLDAEVLTSDPHSLDDVLADVERLGQRLGRAERAESVSADLERRIEGITDRTPEAGPRVAVLDWLDPVMVAGHWVPGMVERVGGEYGLADPGARSRPREWAAIREYDPEVLVVAPCGFGLEQTRENLTDLTNREGWAELSAVQNGRVYAIDGHHYMNRPGPRLVDSLAALASAVHPGTVDPPAEAVSQLSEQRVDTGAAN